MKMFPPPLGRELLEPVVGSGQFRKHRNGSGIFDRIRKPASFGNGPEAVLVIFDHIIRIDREERISRRIPPDPGESAQPVIRRRGAWPFDMRACRKKLTLRVKHCGAEWQE